MAHAKSANPNDFILPDLGEGVHEAELIKWRVEVGQTVDEHDILADMETDKALVEVPSPRPGVIAKLWGEEGEIMHVGNPLVSFEGEGGGTAEAEAKPAKKPSKKKGAGSNGQAPAPAPETSAEREDAGTVVGNVSGGVAGVTSEGGKALATPAVRRLAREMGVDINAIAGSGIGGRVTEKDVRAAGAGGGAAPAARQAPSAPAPLPAAAPGAMPSRVPEAPPKPEIPQGSESARIPFRGVRRTIANRLRESINQAVHFTVMDEADCTALDAVRKRLAGASGEKVSFLPFVASAVCRALSGKFGAMNATTDDANEEIVVHRAVHLGIATDTDTGLMVPVIRDADALGVLQMGREITRVAMGARDRSIGREELVGSTFTISNVGSHAGRFATPVINYPEVGILAVGRAHEGMVVKNGWYRVGKLLPLSLACDHRVVDGATAALCLAEIKRLLEDEAESLMTPSRGS